MFGMFGNYDQRKVDRYEDNERNIIISTAAVTDSAQPYETAISSPSYNGGAWVIVGTYDNRSDAKNGHSKWVEKMTSSNLPQKIKDVSTSKIALLAKTLGGDMIFEKEE